MSIFSLGENNLRLIATYERRHLFEIQHKI